MKFSTTSLREIFDCGERYRQRYVEHFRTPPPYNVILGRAVDHTATLDLSYKIRTGSLLAASDITDLTRNCVEDIVMTEGMWMTEAEVTQGMTRLRSQLVNEAIRMAHLHHCYIAPRLEPTQVQREFEIQIAGHTVTGRMDVQEGSRAIRDLKVSGSSPALDAADRSTQLTIYAMACAELDGRIPDALYLDYLVNTTQPRVVKLQTTRARHHFAAVEDRVRMAARMVEQGIFPPANREHWLCSEKTCSCFSGCNYV